MTFHSVAPVAAFPQSPTQWWFSMNPEGRGTVSPYSAELATPLDLVVRSRVLGTHFHAWVPSPNQQTPISTTSATIPQGTCSVDGPLLLPPDQDRRVSPRSIPTSPIVSPHDTGSRVSVCSHVACLSLGTHAVAHGSRFPAHPARSYVLRNSAYWYSGKGHATAVAYT